MKTEESRYTAKYGLTVNSVITSLFNMNYENEKPKRIDLQETAQTNDIEPFFDYLLTKSPCWTYENEYRLISDDNTNIKKFKKDELEGVIFGLRIKHHDACTVYKIIEENYINKGMYIKCYKVVECENEYAVEIEEVKNIHEYLENLSLKIW